MAISREELLQAVREVGFVIEHQAMWSRCMDPAHRRDTHRRLYIAHAYDAHGNPRVDLSRFSIRHPAVVQRDPEAEAVDHKGNVLGVLDFERPDREVWDAFRQALRAIREQPALFPGLLTATPVTADVASGDPLDEPFPDAAQRALALFQRERLTERDRSRAVREQGFPRHVFRWLSGAMAIKRVTGRGKPYELTDKGRSWLLAPELIDAAYEAGSVPRWKRVIRQALSDFAISEGLDADPARPFILRDRRAWTQNLWSGLRDQVGPALRIPDIDLHRWVHHLQSSQAFALNVFGPLAVATATQNSVWAWARELWAPWFQDVTAVRLEYPADDDTNPDPLGEVRDGQPHRTRIDVLVEHDGGQTATLIEVKLTEPEFGRCSAGHDRKNPHRKVCETKDWTLDTARGCALVLEHGREYFRLLKGPTFVNVKALEQRGALGCPFRASLYQLTRNLLVATELQKTGRAVRFAVFAPGPTLNPRLHDVARREGVRDLSMLLQELTAGKGIATQVIPFEDMLCNAVRLLDENANAWRLYITRKYLHSLEEATSR